MHLLLHIAFFLGLVSFIGCPPVTTKKPPDTPPPEDAPQGDLSDYMEYHRYLQEVVQALESDPEFREKLEKAEEADIRTGKIAHELEFVNHNVRTRLDEIKRQELARLRHLATKQYELTNDIDTDHIKISGHLDHGNEHTFEVEDLKRLILKTTEDLAEADKKRREEFKEYELQKEYEKQEKLKELDDDHKKEYEQKLHDLEEKHKKHDPLHHPGSKQQLEEVWEKQDHMENQEFDPKTFFMLHDLDGNGVWDQDEVKALFLKELDKLYQSGAPEDDMRERAEEMERMREHVFTEADTNKDQLLSYAEFLAQTKKEEFERDQGWDGLDTQKVYTREEYAEFERRRHEEVQRMVQQGLLPPNALGYDVNQQHGGQFPPQGHPAYQNLPVPPPPGQQFHPGQIPQGQVHPQQLHPGQAPPQGSMYPNQNQPQYQGQAYQGQQQQQNYHGQPMAHQGQQPQAQQAYQGQQPVYQGQQQQYHEQPQAQQAYQGQQPVPQPPGLQQPLQHQPNQGGQLPPQGQVNQPQNQLGNEIKSAPQHPNNVANEKPSPAVVAQSANIHPAAAHAPQAIPKITAAPIDVNKLIQDQQIPNVQNV